MKKIIAFSLWGNEKIYTIGAIRNAELGPTIYPGWICRFYIDFASVPKDIILVLRSLNCEIVAMSPGDFRSTLWRFVPASDPDVEIMLSRDTDSRLTLREKIAVDEWLASGKNFHIIRDHPEHMYTILAGMWGCHCNILRDMVSLIGNWKLENRRQIDQEFLANVIYPRIRDDCFVHDEFHIFPHEEVHRIQHDRVDYEHIGGYVDICEHKSLGHCEALKRWLSIYGKR